MPRSKRNPRFWKKVRKDPSGCWFWTGALTPDGYGRFNGKLAHRVAWEEEHGPLGADVDLHHKCENKPCIRPTHLQIIDHTSHGTHHGLEAQGVPFEQQGKLTAARVRKMAAEARMAELAVEEREGTLIPLESFRRLLDTIVAELRARISAFPGKYAPRVVGLKATAEGQALLEEVSNEFLTALRETGRDLRDAETRRSERPQPRRRGRPRGPSTRSKTHR